MSHRLCRLLRHKPSTIGRVLKSLETAGGKGVMGSSDSLFVMGRGHTDDGPLRDYSDGLNLGLIVLVS